MQVGLEARTAAAALYVALIREGQFDLADRFVAWWWSETSDDLKAAYPGLPTRSEWDADELGIDEEDLWP